MASVIHLVLPIPPSINAAYANSTKPGRRGRFKTKRYEDWIAEAQFAVMRDQVRGSIDGAYAIHVEIDRPDKRRRDLSNMLKVIEDFCVSAGFVTDDRFCEAIKMKWTSAVEGHPGPVRVWLIETGVD